MKRKGLVKILLIGSMVGFLVNAASFLLMPVEELRYLPGILFWSGLLLGIAPQPFAGGIRKKESEKLRQLPGLLTFFSSSIAKVTDVALIVGFVATAIILWVSPNHGYIRFVLIAVTVLAFGMHCVVNGKNFRWAFGPERSDKTAKDKQVRNREKEREENV